jgi:hypothetical protein
MRQHVIRVALVVHRDRHTVRERGARPRRAIAGDPERCALTFADTSRAQTLLLHDGLARLDRALRAMTRHRDRYRVIDERFRFVDDFGRQSFEA